MSTSVRYEKSSKREFVRLVRSCAIGWHVLIWLIRGIKQAGLRPHGTKSNEESKSTSVRYKKSSGRDFVRLVRSHVIGWHVLVRPIREIKQA